MKIAILPIVLAFSFQVASAQETTSATTPVSRAAVKQEARDAQKQGAIARGEASPTMHKDHSPSTANRAHVKSETRAAAKAGAIPRGNASLELGRDNSKSLASRAQVKEEARVAQQAGQIPRGEAQIPNN